MNTYIIAYWRDGWFAVYDGDIIPAVVMRRDPPDSYRIVS